MTELELLAPARNAEIGIAAVDCGADAVYIAGPGFGARQDAGNSVEDIRRLCTYAHRFGVRILATVNTIIYESELPEVRELIRQLADAGADALIVQDPAIITLAGEEGIGIPLHASTQCAIRTPEKAAFLEGLGFSRLVLERQLSLEEIKAIRQAVTAELEAFVHGALCVCYSGECYLSEFLSGRSANRGACIQACRSLYDLADGDGRVLVKDKALLSLKDFNLLYRVRDLALSGVSSFKIEGRLKNTSYVKNTVRSYSNALDALIAANPGRWRRASWGKVSGGFVPDLEKTFNRGYTPLFIDGERGKWSSMDAPKSMGEEIGRVQDIRRKGASVRIAVALDDGGTTLSNGDGFAVISRSGGIIGFRGDVCEGNTITCKAPEGISTGDRIFRNLDSAFERELEGRTPARHIRASISVIPRPEGYEATAETEDGRSERVFLRAGGDIARDPARMLSSVREQLSKRSGIYSFSASVPDTADFPVPFLTASQVNSIRRDLASRLDSVPCRMIPMPPLSSKEPPRCKESITYKDNTANSMSERIYRGAGATRVEPAYEISHDVDAELMRTRYCIRHELGLCAKYQGAKPPRELFLINNGRRLALGFDCVRCEMTVKSAPAPGPRPQNGRSGR